MRSPNSLKVIFVIYTKMDLAVNIGHYLHELLFENECVIFPGLGAFVTNYKPAQINNELNTISPPSSELTFNPKLKNDDGLLIKAISEGEGISFTEAQNKVEKLRGTILYKLDLGEKVEIENIGHLQYDEHKNLLFEPKNESNLLIDSYGLENTTINENTVTPPPSAVTTVVSKPKEKQQRKKSKLWLLFFLLPIIAGAVYLFYNPLEIKQTTSTIPEPIIQTEDTSETEEEPIIQTDTIVNDTMDTKVEKVSQDKSTNPALSDKKYYLVGGSFKDKVNADKYYSQLTSDGYSPIDMGLINNFYFVAVSGFSSLGEAKIAKQEYVDKNPESGVWIFLFEE